MMKSCLLLVVLMLVTASGAAAASPTEVIGHWRLDGNPVDQMRPAHDGVILGRSAFQESPVAGGKCLWCNGVDTAVRIDGVANPGVGDFSVSLWVCPLDNRGGVIARQGVAKQGWSIELSPARAIKFVVASRSIETASDRIGFGQWYHLVCTENNGKISISLNGETAASGESASPAALASQPLWLASSTETKSPQFAGLLQDVQLFRGALTADDIASLTDAGLPWLRAKAGTSKPFDRRFTIMPDDVLVLTGGEDANAMQTAGYLETFFTVSSAAKKPLFRDMAWEGDTVFEQWRILNFGPWPQQFESVGASVILSQFGQMESLNGAAGVDEFIMAYEKLLDIFSQRTKRIVLISPTRFQKVDGAMPDLSTRNVDLKRYVDAIKKLAEKRGLLYVDLFTPLQQSALAHPLTRDGVHLTAYGQYMAAREIALQLGIGSTDPVSSEKTPRFQRKELEQLRTDIVAKNHLWLRYWRPTNWAFMNGDRITQPSSRDHVDSRIRWLPAEVQEYAAIIAKQESLIANEAKAITPP